MATVTINYGTRTAFGSFSNLNSLANDNSKPTAHVDNTSTKAVDYAFWLELTLGASSVTATGYIEVYLLESQISGSGDTTDGIDMSTPANSDQDANIKNARKILVLTANANSQVVRYNGRLLDYIANVPNFWGLLIRNMSGAAFASSGHDGQYVPLKYEVT
jgi:hypothetical protein